MTSLPAVGRSLFVERFSGVIKSRRLDDDPEGADDTGGREDPEEKTIKDHRDELPVLFHLTTQHGARVTPNAPTAGSHPSY